MEQLMREYAYKVSKPVEMLKFQFDGVDIHNSDTAETLDMDSGDCLDVMTL